MELQEIEQCAMHNEPLPEDAGQPEQYAYLCLRRLYQDYYSRRIPKEQAQREKKQYCRSYREVRKALMENASLRRKLKDMQEEYLETCFGECAGDPEVGEYPCKFWVAPDVNDNNMPVEGYCSIRATLEGEE